MALLVTVRLSIELLSLNQSYIWYNKLLDTYLKMKSFIPKHVYMYNKYTLFTQKYFSEIKYTNKSDVIIKVN